MFDTFVLRVNDFRLLKFFCELTAKYVRKIPLVDVMNAVRGIQFPDSFCSRKTILFKNLFRIKCKVLLLYDFKNWGLS